MADNEGTVIHLTETSSVKSTDGSEGKETLSLVNNVDPQASNINQVDLVPNNINGTTQNGQTNYSNSDNDLTRYTSGSTIKHVSNSISLINNNSRPLSYDPELEEVTQLNGPVARSNGFIGPEESPLVKQKILKSNDEGFIGPKEFVPVNNNAEAFHHRYNSMDEKVLDPKDHEEGYTDPRVVKKRNKFDDYFAKPKDHFTYDINDTDLRNNDYKLYDDASKKFTGSTSLINSEKDLDKEYMINYGLEKYEKYRVNGSGADGEEDPIPHLTPLRPFTNMDPDVAHAAIFKTYNRMQLPIADVEFRKGFKHVLISRPECYVMARSGTDVVLSEQAENDTDFSSTYSRMPYLLKLLSPCYITGNDFSANDFNTNWNYLLCNRLVNINDDFKTSIGVVDQVNKSIEGHSVVPGRTLESVQGSTITLTFRETKNFEVSEFLRLWMLYIHKIRKGIFAPSYNYYQYRNDFISEGPVTIQSLMLHPYDRALDYCASLFEMITNESMSKIIYWTKWYGVYPTDYSISGSGDNGLVVGGSDMTVSATFRYQKKEINNNRSLVEFNYNAGITNDIGQSRSVVGSQAASHLEIDTQSNKYLGPTDMFTGTPYVVIGIGPKDPITNKNTLVPYLKFSSLEMMKNTKFINIANNGIYTPTISPMTGNIGRGEVIMGT